jgi:3-deoxy-7-phosphoheptulonate synthase
MLITLANPSATPLKAWLTRRGIESRVMQDGMALLIADAWVPPALVDELRAQPDVKAVEATHDLPQHVLDRNVDLTPLAVPAELPLVAGPCAIESREHIEETAAFLAGLGVRWLRGGCNKTRTRPGTFQGHGIAAARWLRDAADAHGMRCVAELTEGEDAEAIAEHLDVIQVGARHMHAPRFLQRLGRIGKPVMLKRGFAATPDEWLWAAEYLLEAGAPAVVFCERGLRTPAPLKRFTLDLGAIPFVQAMTPYPIWVDPSHAAGASPYVAPLARAAIAAGAQAVIVECHPDPGRARSDALQALDFETLATLAQDLRRLTNPALAKAGAR